MRIEQSFEYDAYWHELSDEFCAHDSEYQANVLNAIGTQFKIWAHDKTRTATHIQLLEIAEQLNEKGKWFIKTLCDYIDKAERSDKCSQCEYYINPDYTRCKECGAESEDK